MSKFDAKCAYKIIELCKQKSGKVSVQDLVNLLGSERNARYGLSQIRAAKLVFEPTRVGRKVESYTMLSTDFSTVTDALALAGAKAAKGTPKAKVAKAPAKAKVKNIHAEANALVEKAVKRGAVKAMPESKIKAKVTKEVPAEKLLAEVGLKPTKAKAKVDPARVSDEAKAAIKAKNLETMKVVSAKGKARRVDVKTEEEVLEEFAKLEMFQDDPREYVPAFLLKESYKE